MNYRSIGDTHQLLKYLYYLVSVFLYMNSASFILFFLSIWLFLVKETSFYKEDKVK